MLRSLARWLRRRSSPRILQLCNGLGAGNIGDELMARAFWSELPPGVDLAVEVLPNYTDQHAAYPSRYQMQPVGWDGSPQPDGTFDLALLVGDTPVTEDLGLGWPLRFLAARLDAVRGRDVPVDAVGVGVDRLRSDDARGLFEDHFRFVRSWTVRSAACREALLDLGVPDDSIVVGADWAWLYRPFEDARAWARRTWSDCGIDPDAPLVVVNAVNERWREATEYQKTIATALDEIHEAEGAQVAFFCQECRPGEFYDLDASRRVQRHMKGRAVIVPNEYYSPDEVLALLSHASATLSQRYHYTVASVLAGTVPVNLLRGQKMEGLNRDLELPEAGRMGEATRELLLERLRDALHRPAAWREHLAAKRAELEARARKNLTLCHELRQEEKG